MGNPAADRRVAHIERIGVLALILAVASTGCLVSPPIEPRDEPNLSPRIRPYLPDETSTSIDVTRESYPDGEVTLAAELYDGNDEVELSYLLVSDQRGILEQSRTGPSVEETNGEFAFDDVVYSFEPCGEPVGVPGTEVISLYVADRGFQSVSPDPRDIVPVQGALMVTFSWTLFYEAGLCDATG